MILLYLVVQREGAAPERSIDAAIVTWPMYGRIADTLIIFCVRTGQRAPVSQRGKRERQITFWPDTALSPCHIPLRQSDAALRKFSAFPLALGPTIVEFLRLAILNRLVLQDRHLI
jgi:hypothetical protein